VPTVNVFKGWDNDVLNGFTGQICLHCKMSGHNGSLTASGSSQEYLITIRSLAVFRQCHALTIEIPWILYSGVGQGVTRGVF
jgi:hypothetical protein